MPTCTGCGDQVNGKFCKMCGKPADAPAAPSAPPAYDGPDPALGFKRALEQGECIECFDRLCKEQSGALFQGGRRSCPHYFHVRCAMTRMGSSRTCRVCNAAFDQVQPFPDIKRDPMGWFKFVDFDNDEKLSKQEVLEALKAAVPVDPVLLMERMPNQWKSEWDKNKDGTICIEEFVSPQGLLAYVEANIPPPQSVSAPALSEGSKEGWFRFWDVDRSNSLEREEVVRALIKTFRLSEDLASVAQMREIIDATWAIFDTDGSGSVEMGEFCMRDGLGDTVIATQRRH
eukprot:CAMPEP_0196734004 /NCGR_PEP_ID=MMETSP1091-20130531/12864_1 /TAXON_ID=302021 /ORGANISM="Rhodomonas sp., Strain CCMP768" /LENGTH=286 /DNA_ID=CAMNT_0042077447 /DNA_START=15 /DNA_END=875 /DNA_ORIENTATION=+